jgi:hypothetical protein
MTDSSNDQDELEQEPIEPNWKALELMMDPAINWIWKSEDIRSDE